MKVLLARAKTTEARGLEIHLIQHKIWQECTLFSWPPNWLKITLLFLTSKIEDLNVSSYTLRQMFASSQINKLLCDYLLVLWYVHLFAWLVGILWTYLYSVKLISLSPVMKGTMFWIWILSFLKKK